MSTSQSHIINLLKQHHGPLDAPSMLTSLKQVIPTLNKTTIYRALEKLLSEGQITEVHLPGRKIFYELAGEHHHHLICTGCDKIEEVHLPHHLHEIEQNLAKETGFEITKHHLEFFGKCGECK